MNTIERISMVKAMEFICRNVNKEDALLPWLQYGVADGDINYGDLSPRSDDAETLEYYLDDETFADLMETFLFVMSGAYSDGGLYCDGVISQSPQE